MATEGIGFTVGVYVDGTTIKVLGVFDSSDQGKEALTKLDDVVATWDDSRPGHVNWVVTEPILPNVIKLPRE